MPFGLFVIPCWILNSNLSDFFFQNTLKSSFHPFPPVFNVAVEISAVNVIVFLLTAFRTFLSVWWSSVSLLWIYGRVFKTATQDSEGLCNLHTVLVILVNERNTSINFFEHHLFLSPSLPSSLLSPTSNSLTLSRERAFWDSGIIEKSLVLGLHFLNIKNVFLSSCSFSVKDLIWKSFNEHWLLLCCFHLTIRILIETKHNSAGVVWMLHVEKKNHKNVNYVVGFTNLILNYFINLHFSLYIWEISIPFIPNTVQVLQTMLN